MSVNALPDEDDTEELPPAASVEEGEPASGPTESAVPESGI